VDATFISLVQASVNFGAGEYFYLSIQEDDLVEEVKVTDVSGTNLVITREQGDTDAQVFTAAAIYNTAMTVADVKEIANGLVAIPAITINGSGIVNVTTDGAGNFTVNVTQPNIAGASGLEVTQAFPDYTVALIAGGNCCAGDEELPGDGGAITINGSGIANVTNDGSGNYTVNVPSPNFTGAGVAITGAWPDLTFTVTASSGTVTGITAGDGLTLTGDPATNPTISIDNTGVIAGVYGDITVNARGQFTNIAVGFNPISAAAVANGLSVARVGSTVTVSGIDAAEGVKGVVALADADSPLDVDDVTTAVTPKLLAGVVSDIAGPSLFGGQVYSGEADSDYTNTVATTAIALTLDATDQVLVIATLSVRDNSAPTVAQEYGMALFTATGTRIQANKKLTQNNQVLTAIITGPLTDGLILKTTALAGSAAVVSQAVAALQI
jgi:hypothetical protein